MKRIILVAVAAAASGLISTANAADMAVKAPAYKAPPSVALYNWTGLYLGIDGGYGWGGTTGDWLGTRGGNFNVNGALFGGQIGFNYQFPASPLVLGIEADWDWANVKGSNSDTSDPGFTAVHNVKIQDLGTVRGRAGYAWDRVLLYGTGGWAWSRRAYVDFTCSGLCTPPFASDTHFLSGYTVGGGIEYGITPNLSAKAEYLYAHLTPTDYFVSQGCVPGICSVGANINVVRLGLNWRFTGLP
jgi:outer membrane immunogenic protein